MDCHEFDGQVVRLDKIKAEAEQFVRVRLPRIDESDLSVFEFDYDVTFMVFLLDADEHVYARYGGRDAENAERRMSLDGLRATMQSVLAEHQAAAKRFAPRSRSKEMYIREVTGGGGRCLHCHQVKEALNRKLVADGDWSRENVWRFPLPENVGVRLDVNRSNVVEAVTPDSPAAKAGLKPGDVLRQLGAVPVHSFGDATFALDKAPAAGTLEVRWARGGEPMAGTLTLADGWRKTDISWRPSMHRLVAVLPLYGDDLKPDERKALGLTPAQLAFRQSPRVREAAKAAGIAAGDVVIGIDDRKLDMGVDDLLIFVRREYLVGDTITLTVLRDGQPRKIPLTLPNR